MKFLTLLSLAVTLTLCTLGCRAASISVGGLPQVTITQPQDFVMIESHDYGLTNVHTYITAETNLYGGVIQPTGYTPNTNVLLLFDAYTSTALNWSNLDYGAAFSSGTTSNVFNSYYNAHYGLSFFDTPYSYATQILYTNTNSVITFSYSNTTVTLLSTDMVNWYYSSLWNPGGDNSLVATSQWAQVASGWKFNGTTGVSVTNLGAGYGIGVSLVGGANTVSLNTTASNLLNGAFQNGGNNTATGNNSFTGNVSLSGGTQVKGDISGGAVVIGGTINLLTLAFWNESANPSFRFTNNIFANPGSFSFKDGNNNPLSVTVSNLNAITISDPYGTFVASTNQPTLSGANDFGGNITFGGQNNFNAAQTFNNAVELNGGLANGIVMDGSTFFSKFTMRNTSGIGSQNFTNLVLSTTGNVSLQDGLGNPVSLSVSNITLATPAAIAPSTNTVLGFLPITVNGTNYYIPLCATNH